MGRKRISLRCPRSPPPERLGAGPADYVEGPVKLGGKCLYVTYNNRLGYIGISTLAGPTRFFAQDEEGNKYLNEFKKIGVQKFVNEYDGYGFW